MRRTWMNQKKWNSYMHVYEECLDKCNEIPWNIVPADQNWYKEYLIATALHELLASLDMHYPAIKNSK